MRDELHGLFSMEMRGSDPPTDLRKTFTPVPFLPPYGKGHLAAEGDHGPVGSGKARLPLPKPYVYEDAGVWGARASRVKKNRGRHPTRGLPRLFVNLCFDCARVPLIPRQRQSRSYLSDGRESLSIRYAARARRPNAPWGRPTGIGNVAP